MRSSIHNVLRANPVVQLMKKEIRSRLLAHQVWIERATRHEAILGFLADVRPVHSSVPLKRFGGPSDGGYLLPDDLEGIGACVSPGVSTECSFDKDIADLSIDVYMADSSVQGPPIEHDRFHFSKLFIDTFNSPTSTTIDDFCKGLAPGSDLLLEMDIEGAEYRVLSAISEELLSRFRILAIEFHHLDCLFSPFGFREISAVFRRLLQTHNIVHIHPNSKVPVVGHGSILLPPAMEFTFYRKDRAEFDDRPLSFPHPLDATNVEGVPDLILPECWYRPTA
jgi:Methyltransferase FkbM domain